MRLAAGRRARPCGSRGRGRLEKGAAGVDSGLGSVRRTHAQLRSSWTPEAPGGKGPPTRAAVGRKGTGLGVRAWFCRGLWVPLGATGVPGLNHLIQLRLKFVPPMFPDLHEPQLVSWVLKIKYKVRPLRIQRVPFKFS